MENRSESAKEFDQDRRYLESVEADLRGITQAVVEILEGQKETEDIAGFILTVAGKAVRAGFHTPVELSRWYKRLDQSLVEKYLDKIKNHAEADAEDPKGILPSDAYPADEQNAELKAEIVNNREEYENIITGVSLYCLKNDIPPSELKNFEKLLEGIQKYDKALTTVISKEEAERFIVGRGLKKVSHWIRELNSSSSGSSVEVTPFSELPDQVLTAYVKPGEFSEVLAKWMEDSAGKDKILRGRLIEIIDAWQGAEEEIDQHAIDWRNKQKEALPGEKRSGKLTN